MIKEITSSICQYFPDVPNISTLPVLIGAFGSIPKVSLDCSKLIGDRQDLYLISNLPIS